MAGTSSPRVTGVILAGGKSSRMGQPKALLPFDDVPLIVHLSTALQRLFGDVVVVAAPDQPLPPLPARVVLDDVAFQGPVGGLCDGLAAVRTDAAFVTSCDAVFLNAALVRHLVSRLDEYDVVVPYWEGRLQPLHAVYRTTVLPTLQAQLARGERRPVTLFERVRTLRIDEDEIRQHDPEGVSFFNMNTPEAYAEARARWSRRAEGAARGETAGPTMPCVVELFGVAQLVAQTPEVTLVVPQAATIAQVLAALAAAVPQLRGKVIAPDGERLIEGYACSINGVHWVRATTDRIDAGDRLVILSADAGG